MTGDYELRDATGRVRWGPCSFSTAVRVRHALNMERELTITPAPRKQGIPSHASSNLPIPQPAESGRGPTYDAWTDEDVPPLDPLLHGHGCYYGDEPLPSNARGFLVTLAILFAMGVATAVYLLARGAL